MTTTVWGVMVYDPWQYQGRASLRSLHESKAAAEAAQAIVAAEIATNEDSDEAYVEDFEVEGDETPVTVGIQVIDGIPVKTNLFEVTRVAQWNDDYTEMVPIEPPCYEVSLPHQCDEWEITRGTRDEAIAGLVGFIDEAQATLRRLRAGQVDGDSVG